jgi:hypothetical protein
VPGFGKAPTRTFVVSAAIVPSRGLHRNVTSLCKNPTGSLIGLCRVIAGRACFGNAPVHVVPAYPKPARLVSAQNRWTGKTVPPRPAPTAPACKIPPSTVRFASSLSSLKCPAADRPALPRCPEHAYLTVAPKAHAVLRHSAPRSRSCLCGAFTSRLRFGTNGRATEPDGRVPAQSGTYTGNGPSATPHSHPQLRQSLLYAVASTACDVNLVSPELAPMAEVHDTTAD